MQKSVCSERCYRKLVTEDFIKYFQGRYPTATSQGRTFFRQKTYLGLILDQQRARPQDVQQSMYILRGNK